MAAILFKIYLVSILLSLAISIYRWRSSDSSIHVIGVLLLFTFTSEIITLICRQHNINFYPVYHFFNPIELGLILMFFYKTLNIKNQIPVGITSFIVCGIIALINSTFLQPVSRINSYFLLFESFSIIILSLYGMYYILKKEQIVNVIAYPQFWIFSCLLLYASSTFLFWGYFQKFFEQNWEYANTLMYMQAGVNIITYISMGLTIFLTSKAKTL